MDVNDFKLYSCQVGQAVRIISTKNKTWLHIYFNANHNLFEKKIMIEKTNFVIKNDWCLFKASRNRTIKNRPYK